MPLIKGCSKASRKKNFHELKEANKKRVKKGLAPRSAKQRVAIVLSNERAAGCRPARKDGSAKKSAKKTKKSAGSAKSAGHLPSDSYVYFHGREWAVSTPAQRASVIAAMRTGPIKALPIIVPTFSSQGGLYAGHDKYSGRSLTIMPGPRRNHVMTEKEIRDQSVRIHGDRTAEIAAWAEAALRRSNLHAESGLARGRSAPGVFPALDQDGFIHFSPEQRALLNKFRSEQSEIRHLAESDDGSPREDVRIALQALRNLQHGSSWDLGKPWPYASDREAARAALALVIAALRTRRRVRK